MERRERHRTPRILQLKALTLPELYEVFESVRVVVGEDAERLLKDITSVLYEREYGEPLTLDEKTLVLESPDKVVAELAKRIHEVLTKHYANTGQATTTGAIRFEASKRAEDLLARSLRIAVAMYGF